MTQTHAQGSKASTSTAPGLLLLALWVLPLLINPVLAMSFDEVYLAPKVLWIYTIVLPSTLLVLWRYREALQNARGPLALLTVWVGWLILSTLLNGVGWPGWWGAPERADGVLMHLIYLALLLGGFVWVRSEAEALHRLEQAVLFGGSLLALTNVLQQVGLMGVPGDGAITGVSATLFGGTLGNRGYMGGALTLLLPVALASLASSRNRWGWLAVILISWAWAGSFTRGAWLAGAVGLLWLVIWARPRPSLRSWSAVLLGVALCVFTTTLRGEGRAFNLSNDATGGGQAIADSSGRAVLWGSALFGIRQRPLLGWGTPALWQAMNERSEKEVLADFGKHDLAGVRRLNSTPREAPRFVVTHADGKRESVVLSIGKVHNEYLDYALTYGLPAAVMFIALLAAAIWSSRTLLPGVSGGLLAYAAYLLTWPEIIRFAPIAWFMMGVALAAYSRRRSGLRT
ncbi:O-antigen ligase family protein [Deinococcus planocerae]|uniref:O-antigen ligase family protein n=1 Tax=Deinococcus planocerae TaxID=1737569 RepID=UPI000C7EF4F5|nr:O-antigen ligase family protein [Deinococcus planocerae]